MWVRSHRPEQATLSTDVGLRPGFAVCKEEMKVYCAKVESGKGRMFRCLQANAEKSDFSAACKAQMQKKQKRMASFWKCVPPPSFLPYPLFSSPSTRATLRVRKRIAWLDPSTLLAVISYSSLRRSVAPISVVGPCMVSTSCGSGALVGHCQHRFRPQSSSSQYGWIRKQRRPSAAAAHHLTKVDGGVLMGMDTHTHARTQV